MTENHITWSTDNSVAVVTIDCPKAKVNTLDEALLNALEAAAKELAGEVDLKAIVVMSGKSKGFIAGADIDIIQNVTDQSIAEDMARRGQEVFQRWADLKIPVVAAINGHCLGGGLEFALACDARLGTPDAQLGLPEVRLGILPGFGGTQRLPRLIGLQKAIELILAGRILSAQKSRQAGLLDKVIPEQEIQQEAVRLALSSNKERKKNTGGITSWLLEGNPIGRMILFNKSAERVAKQTKGHYPAPVKALEVIRRTCSMSLEEGLVVEARALGELAVSKECKNLVQVYKLSQRAKHIPAKGVDPAKIDTAAVLGAGVMGSGIAWLLAQKGLQVTLKDIAKDAVNNGMERIRGWAEKRPSEAKQKATERINGTISEEDIKGSDLVIEAVLEKMEIKKQVIQNTEQILNDSAIFASNTSSLSISEMQSASRYPDQVVGLHFFNPVERMPLVEIIRGKDTSDQTIATTFALANRLGKIPILVADSPGFLVNRLLVAYLNEACLLVEQGINWQSIDTLATDYGMPMGPFRLIDEVGIDIASEVGSILCNAFYYLQESSLLQTLLNNDLLGRKGGKGFYLYQGKDQTINRNISEFLPEEQRKAENEDWQRLMMLMVAEASRCLGEGIVTSPEDIDTGMIFGTGFPPFRGGLCRWADSFSEKELGMSAEKFTRNYGERFSLASDYQVSMRFYR